MNSSNYYQVGTGKADITPPLSVPYLGFKPRHSEFKGVHDPLFVRAAAIKAGERTVAIIEINSIGFDNAVLGQGRNFTAEVKDRIKRETGINEGDVMVVSSHIHSTPDTLNFRPLIDSEGALEWLETVMDKIVLSVKSALGCMFNVVLKTAAGSVEGISKNRRGEGTLDTGLSVMMFEGTECDRKIILVNYACHPVIMQVQDLISADYVGVLESSVELSLKNTQLCIFLQGACGDINPRLDDTRNFEDAYNMGMALAGEVITLCSRMSFKDYPVHPVRASSASRSVMLPSRDFPENEEVERICREVELFRSGKSGEEPCRSDMEAYYRLIEGEGAFPAELQVLRIGDCIVAGIPAEIFNGTGKELKAAAEPMIPFIAGYANGYLGYILPQALWDNGGYETRFGPWSKISPMGCKMIVSVIEELVNSLR